MVKVTTKAKTKGPKAAKAAKPAAAAPSRIVEATGVAVRAKDKGLAQAVEAAMVAAINEASADGITDPKRVKERMMAAREKARVEYVPAGRKG